MTLRTALALALPVGFSLACGPLQSYSAGLQVICDAPNTCTECANATADTKQSVLALHIEERLWNPSAIEAFQALAYASPSTRAEILRHEAQENGITSCPLADMFDDMARAENQLAVQKICAISTDCGQFDASDPASFTGCVNLDELPSAIQDTIDTEIDTTSSSTLAAGLQKLAAAHGQPACAAAAAYRNP